MERTGEQSYRYRQQSSLLGAIILEVNESSTTVMEAWWGVRGDTGEGREIWVSGARAPPVPPPGYRLFKVYTHFEKKDQNQTTF